MNKKAVGLVIFCLLLPETGFAGPPKRELRVAVAVAPSFKTLPNWKFEFERRLGYASRIFESQFKLKFHAAAYADWPVADEKGTPAELLEDLRSHFPIDRLEGVDLVIGLSRLNDFSGKDLHTIGQARPFSGYLMLRYPFNRLFKIQEETVLAHEMGHLFGAVHTSDRNSIMSPVVDRQIPNRFDRDNEQIILLTRDMDFRKGVDVLKGGALQVLLNSYMKLIQTSQSGDFYYALGIFYLRLGDPEKTVKTWQKALTLEDNPQIHYDLGALYLKLDRKPEAVKELSKAVAGFHFPSQRKNEAFALGVLGEAYLAEGNLFAAYNSLRKASSLQPENWDIKTNLALVQIQRGQTQEGLTLLLLALKKDGNNVRILSNIGKAYYQMSQYEDALKYLNRALEAGKKKKTQAGDLVEIYGTLGSTYIKMGKSAEALQSFNAACEKNPSVECHKKLGLLSFQLGLWDNCVRELGSIVQREKIEDPDVYGALGVALLKSNDLGNAAAIFREGIRYAKDNKTAAKFHNNIAQIFTTQHQFAPAEKEFQMAIAKDWSNVDSHFGLALAYLGKQDLQNAREALQHVLKLDSRHPKAKEMLRNIDNSLKAKAA